MGVNDLIVCIVSFIVFKVIVDALEPIEQPPGAEIIKQGDMVRIYIYIYIYTHTCTDAYMYVCNGKRESDSEGESKMCADGKGGEVEEREKEKKCRHKLQRLVCEPCRSFVGRRRLRKANMKHGDRAFA